MTTEQTKPVSTKLREILERAKRNASGCTCGPAYKSRDMSDPDCAACEFHEVVQCVDEALSELEALELRDQAQGEPVATLKSIPDWIPISLACPEDLELPSDAQLLVWDTQNKLAHLARCGDAHWPGSPNVSHWAEIECPWGTNAQVLAHPPNEATNVATTPRCPDCGSSGAFCSFDVCPMSRPAPPKEAPAEPTEEELVKMLRGGQITVRPLEAPVSSIVEAYRKSLIYRRASDCEDLAANFHEGGDLVPLLMAATFIGQAYGENVPRAALSSPAPTAKVLTSQIKTAYAGNHAYYMDNKPEGSTYREHCKLLMEELIDELQEDGYLSSPKPQVSVEEIMEVVMSRVRNNADDMGYVTFYINDEAKMFETNLRDRLTKLMDR